MIARSRTDRSPLLEWWRGIDRVLLGLVALLLLCGVILSMAASPAAANRLGLSDQFYYLYRHVVYVMLGLFGAFFVSMLSLQNARRLGVLALVGGIVLLIATMYVGHEVKGATRWLRFGPFSLQPVEFVKPAFIVFASWMFAESQKHKNLPGQWINFAVFLGLVGLLLMQPDFGQSFLLALCFGALFFFAGVSMAWMLLLGVLTMAGISAAYAALPHVRARIASFMNPEESDTFQVDKAEQAITAGGFWGKGPGEGDVKYQIPDAHTDFIFSVAAEEFGFIISFCLILLIGALVLRGYWKAMKLTDQFSQLATAGLTTMIGLQAVINLSVNLGIVPPKGMTLPFISSGGSSLLALAFTVGLLLAFTRNRPGAYEYSRFD